MYRHLTNEELQHQFDLEQTPELIAEVLHRVRTGAMFFAPRMERSSL